MKVNWKKSEGLKLVMQKNKKDYKNESYLKEIRRIKVSDKYSKKNKLIMSDCYQMVKERNH